MSIAYIQLKFNKIQNDYLTQTLVFLAGNEMKIKPLKLIILRVGLVGLRPIVRMRDLGLRGMCPRWENFLNYFKRLITQVGYMHNTLYFIYLKMCMDYNSVYIFF